MPANSTSETHAGRVALVTGTSRGIGQAIAVGLAERGARVVLADRGDAGETIARIADAGHEAVPPEPSRPRPGMSSTSTSGNTS
jgi:NAD(P)-dependent dehydrogenase (short-subunit alcohol dehydrogenase family)